MQTIDTFTALIVDPERSRIDDLTRKLLRLYPHCFVIACYSVEDYRQMYEQVAVGELAVDLVLMYRELTSDSGGQAVASHLATLHNPLKIPVVFTTTPESLARSTDEDGQFVLSSPIDPDELFVVVSEVLKQTFA
jgi:response regulator RpfG family c-di-GMP phosphodiesterase